MAGQGWLIHVFTGLLHVAVCSALLELQELVEWKIHRNLYDYKAYGAITLERIDIPLHPVLVNLSSSVESSSSSCPVRSVDIYASQFGFPVVSRDKEVFPSKVYVSKTPVWNVTVPSNKQTVVWQVDSLTKGQLFLMAVMAQSDSRIKQQGLQEECDYFLNIQAVVLNYAEEDIAQLGSDTSQVVLLNQKSQTLLSFKVPVDASSYTVDIQGCSDTHCPVNVSLWDLLPDSMQDGSIRSCQWKKGSCILEVMSPAVDRLSYLSLSSDMNVTLTILIVNSFCDRNYNFSDLHPLTRRTTLFPCTSLGDLGRETSDEADDSSNFNDHFVTWDKKFTPHSMVNLKVLDTAVVVTRFRLRISDTGTSLKVSLHLPVEKKTSLAHVTLCLSAHHLYHPRQCDGGAVIKLTNQEGSHSDYVIVPYPQSGLWFISLEAQCFRKDVNTSKEVAEPCKTVPDANLTVHLAPCIDGGCGDYGTCKLYMEADILFSACNCFSGWRGYGCNDGSRAVDATEERLAVYLLTISNLGFFPSICLAVYRRFYVEALVYSYNMFFSTFYHACDTSEVYKLCIMPYNSLSFADFFASLLSFWVTLMAMARIWPGTRSFLHMVSALFISLGEVYNRHGLVEQLLPIVGGVLIVLVSWAVESYKRKSVFPSKRRLLKFILPGVTLSCLGLVINLACQTDANYKYTHSTWHLLESTCILLLLPPRRQKSGTLSVQSGDITRQNLLDSQDFQANIHHADDTGAGSGPGSQSQPTTPPHTPTNWRDSGFQLLTRGSSRHSQNLVL